MDIEIQQNLLRYVVQQANKYIEHLDESIFTLIEHKVTVQILKAYYSKYGALPSETLALKFMRNTVNSHKEVTDELKKDLEEVFQDLYVPLNKNDIAYYRDHIITKIQDKLINNLYADFAEGKIDSAQLFRRMDKIKKSFQENEEEVQEKGTFLIRDKDKHIDETVEGHPTFLKSLNSLTAARGFYSPQLIVIMSAPKHFKTGIIIKLAVEYARDGYNVYYADAENSVRDIRMRSKMCIMECSAEELEDPAIQDELDILLDRFGKYRGGDLFIDSYPAGIKSIQDVESRLNDLKEDYDFVPDIIVYDSIDHFIPSDIQGRKQDKRIRIGDVYHEAIALNKKIGSFAIAPSQVNRNAVGKKTFNMGDIAESFDKIANCHACYAICATPDEEDMGLRRVVPVVQRGGVKQGGDNFCVVQIDEERMVVKEVDKEEL